MGESRRAFHVMSSRVQLHHREMTVQLDHLTYHWQDIENNMTIPGKEDLLADPKKRELLRSRNPELVYLFEHIRDNGMVNPLLVRRTGLPDHYRVVVGSQRLQCLRALGRKDADCLLIEAGEDQRQVYHQLEPIRWDKKSREWRKGEWRREQ